MMFQSHESTSILINTVGRGFEWSGILRIAKMSHLLSMKFAVS